MPVGPEARARLRVLIEQGAARCVDRLGKIAGAPWRADSVTLSPNGTIPPTGVLPPSDNDHYGAFFTLRGGAFLAVFHRKTGLLVTHRLTAGVSDEVADLYKLESEAVSEAANMLTSTFLAPFSDALGRELILSAPTRMIGRRQELLARALAQMEDPEAYALRGAVRLCADKPAADASLVFFMGPELVAGLS